MAKYKIFVDGSSGTTGLRIADRLAARDEFEILHISEADRKDVNARAAVINQSDLSFLCLPDAAAREVVPLLRPDVRILDTSTAHTAPRRIGCMACRSCMANGMLCAPPTAWLFRAAMPPALSRWWPRWWSLACWLQIIR